ncbi:hypothetical protein EI94DRAFT_1801628 [Lactarius quietus]|nr:hypothetical protein EI94DRAFT_1801628 [Lactarius quietus]
MRPTPPQSLGFAAQSPMTSALGLDSSPLSSPTIKSSVRRHEREGESIENAEGGSSPKRWKIEPTSSPSAPVPTPAATQATINCDNDSGTKENEPGKYHCNGSDD